MSTNLELLGTLQNKTLMNKLEMCRIGKHAAKRKQCGATHWRQLERVWKPDTAKRRYCVPIHIFLDSDIMRLYSPRPGCLKHD